MTEQTTTLSQFDFEDLLIYAQRYSIGRMTFAPHTVCEIINMHINRLSKNTLNVIKRDIVERRDEGNLGSPVIDAPVWIRTLENIMQDGKIVDLDIPNIQFPQLETEDIAMLASCFEYRMKDLIENIPKRNHIGENKYYDGYYDALNDCLSWLREQMNERKLEEST